MTIESIGMSDIRIKPMLSGAFYYLGTRLSCRIQIDDNKKTQLSSSLTMFN